MQKSENGPGLKFCVEVEIKKLTCTEKKSYGSLKKQIRIICVELCRVS
jgi:hypothetical protein